ncbi:MAG: Ig-like domain-containing protein [Desulfococcaceae bacterium]|jgi:hypothetical protein|nr:Ig-like domain-containing protein [Desulfococcaceae bacterium]
MKCTINIIILCCLLCWGCSGGIEDDNVEELQISVRLYDESGSLEISEVSEAAPGLLTATLTDLNGDPIVGETVTFTTNSIGRIQDISSIVTDDQGRASAVLYAGSAPGIGTATASYSSFSASVSYHSLGDQKNYQIRLKLYNAESGEEADILSKDMTGRLEAVLTDQDDILITENEDGTQTETAAAVPGQRIRFSVSLGEIDPSEGLAVTDNQGTASVFLKPGTLPGTGVATAEIGSFSDTLSYYINVQEEELKLSLSMKNSESGEETDIVKSGTPAILVAALSDEEGVPVSGMSIRFTASRGILEPENGEAVTDSQGKASVFLLAGSSPGAGVVTAEIDSLSDTLTFYADTAEEAVNISLRLLDADSGEEISIITSDITGKIIASVTDENGTPLAGKTLDFDTSLGSLDPEDGQAVSNSQGEASVFLLTGSAEGSGTLTARYENSSDSLNFFAENKETALNLSLQLLDAASGTETGIVSADVTGQLVATLTDEEGLPVSGKTITFSSSLGTLDPASAETNSEGKASVFLLAGSEAGSATAQAQTGDLSESLGFMVEVTEESFSIAMKLLNADSGAETGTISPDSPGKIVASLTDQDGQPVSGATIAFSASLGNLNPASGQAVTDGGGEAGIFLEAGTSGGLGEVTATYGSDSAALSFLVNQQSLILRLTDEQGNEKNSFDQGDPVRLKALLTDRNGDALVGEFVTFTASLGSLSPESATAITSSAGEAEISLDTGGAEGSGLAQVFYGQLSDSANYIIIVP